MKLSVSSSIFAVASSTTSNLGEVGKRILIMQKNCLSPAENISWDKIVSIFSLKALILFYRLTIPIIINF